MLKPSTRGDQMPASPIRKLVPFAEEAKKRGMDLNLFSLFLNALITFNQFDYKELEKKRSIDYS